MRSTNIIDKDRNSQKKSEQRLVVVFIDSSEINCENIQNMLQINKNEVLRMVRIISSEEMCDRIISYVKELGIDKGKGDKVYLYSERGLMPYDCEI